jgi:signal transduction histidine kinase
LNNKPRARRTSLDTPFGDLKVRLKLVVLHNFFFFVLTLAVYFTLIPIIRQRIKGARIREAHLVTQLFSEDRPLPSLAVIDLYDYREGTADDLSVPFDVREWLHQHPGQIFGDAAMEDFLYRKVPATGMFRRLRVPHAYYQSAVSLARWALFGVLGIIYVLAVLMLELVIMPLYVYRPLRLMLDADWAAHLGDREHEYIDDRFIPKDEIGQIMASRNKTIGELRAHEDDLIRKNLLLEEAKRTIESQDRLASLGLLSASVAHELNTPLAVLHGSIEKLIETVPGSAHQERLKRMLRVTERIRQISEGLVDFARGKKDDMETVILLPVIEEAWTLVAFDDKAAQVSLYNRTDPALTVQGNAGRLVQVFVNLLRNALDAVQLGGEILVESRAQGEWTIVTVADNGPGIPPDVLPNIFDAFITSRLDSRGTGLGLAVAEGIVHQHGGKIEASNRPGGGALLTVELPNGIHHSN